MAYSEFISLTDSEIVENAVDQFLSESRVDGDVVSHEWLQTYLKIPTPETVAEAKTVQWLTLRRVDEFRDILLYKYKIALDNIHGIGYRLVPPSQQAEFAIHKAVKHIKKGIGDAIELLEHTRMDELELDQKKRHIDAQVKMIGLESLMNREQRDAFNIFENNKRLEKSA